ncbi:MAG: aspartate kinase [Bdellovibrionales bacterium]|nr:aspartate kinase [Bdellovibrionales bacterium]
MALIVQKFGGTSVGSVERIRGVAARVLDTVAQGHRVAVVTSAMSGETNRLVALAHDIDPLPFSREYDLILSAGEQVAVGLLALAINAEARKRGLVPEGGTKARGYLGHQVGIHTDNGYSKARIREIDTKLLFSELDAGIVPVVAGFQGVDDSNSITTLGRGGSDTSAVALAAALRADDCEIYTDVDGVYTTDPRLCPKARKIERISYEEMMELASLGAKVLQIRSVELAAKFRVPLHVISSFSNTPGTRVVHREELGMSMEQVDVSGVAADNNQVKYHLRGLPNRPGVAAMVFGALTRESIVVDVIVQDMPVSGMASLSFTVGEAEALRTQTALERLKAEAFREMEIQSDKSLAKVSIVGVGMQHHPGVAARMFQILGEQNIDIRLISTSEIKVSCLVAADQMKLAVESLHRGFGLDRLD